MEDRAEDPVVDRRESRVEAFDETLIDSGGGELIYGDVTHKHETCIAVRDMPRVRTPEFHEPKNSVPTVRLTAEFREMPGLRLTAQQTARLIGVDIETASSVLTTLVDRGFLRLTANGYVLA